jgi:hypothetical protein
LARADEATTECRIPHGHPGGDPNAMNAVTKGCLAGTGVCFISFEGEVFPCGYLPALAGDLRKQPFSEIWNKSAGLCRPCATPASWKASAAAANSATSAWAAGHELMRQPANYMASEPFCVYEPKTLPPQPAQPRRVSGTPD